MQVSLTLLLCQLTIHMFLGMDLCADGFWVVNPTQLTLNLHSVYLPAFRTAADAHGAFNTGAFEPSTAIARTLRTTLFQHSWKIRFIPGRHCTAAFVGSETTQHFAAACALACGNDCPLRRAYG